MDFTNLAGIAAGSVAGSFADQAPFFSTLDPKIQSLVKIAIGVFGPQYIKGEFGKGLGAGLVASGAADLASDFGLVSGVGKYIRGVGADVPTIGATSTAQTRRPQLDELQSATMTFSDNDVPTIAGLGALGLI